MVSQQEEQTVLSSVAHWCLVLRPQWYLIANHNTDKHNLYWWWDLSAVAPPLHVCYDWRVLWHEDQMVPSPHLLAAAGSSNMCVESMNWARHSPRDSLMSDSHTQSHTSFFPCNHTNKAVVCLYPRCWEGETSDRISHSYAISTFNWINNVIKFGIKSIKDPWASWKITAVWPNLYYMGRDEH